MAREEIGYIYDGELFCEPCGERLKKEVFKRIWEHDPVEAERQGELSPPFHGDSGAFPQEFLLDDEANASDTPMHCGSQDACLDKDITDLDDNVSKLLTRHLTGFGCAYVIQAALEKPGSPLMGLWLDRFKNQLPRRKCCDSIWYMEHDQDECVLHDGLMRVVKLPLASGMAELAMYDLESLDRKYAPPRWAVYCELRQAGKVLVESIDYPSAYEAIDSDAVAGSAISWSVYGPHYIRGSVLERARPWLQANGYELQIMALCLKGEYRPDPGVDSGLPWCTVCGKLREECPGALDMDECPDL